MPGPIDQGRSDQLKHVNTFQVLACEFQIEVDSSDFADRLRYVVQHASQDHAISERVRYRVAAESDRLLVHEDDAVVAVEPTSELALEALFKRIQQRSFAALPDDIRIHAASGIHEGRMFLLVGNPHAGKTTLALHLLMAGIRIVGDELVMLRNGMAAAYPRKFYPRESSFDLVPVLRPLAPALPRVYDADGTKRVAVDPAALGRPWHIARLPVGAIFYLEPDFGRPTSVRRISKVEMVRMVMEQCAPPVSRRADWIGDLCTTINGATAHLLSVGTMETALAAVTEALSGPGAM